MMSNPRVNYLVVLILTTMAVAYVAVYCHDSHYLIAGADDDKYPFLSDLNDELLIDEETLAAGTLGIQVKSLRGLRCDKLLLEKCRTRRNAVDFRKCLIEKLNDEDSWLGAYALLNQLFPDKKLELSVRSFSLIEGNASVPVFFHSSDEETVIVLRHTTLASIAHDYWTATLLDK